MARLTSSKPRIVAAKPKFGGIVRSEKERSRYRDQTQPWRAWYKTARWRQLRREVLKRDGYTCQATGVMLVGKYPADDSPVIDHKVPHRGDAQLFWDEGNLQALSKVYHDAEKQRIEQRDR